MNTKHYKLHICISPLIFTIILLTFGNCNQDGPCQSPLKWEIESVNTSAITAKINKKDVHIKVCGEGTIVFNCKNKKEKILRCSLKINEEIVQPNSEYFNDDESEFKNSYVSVFVNPENNTVTMSFKDLPETDMSMRIWVHSLEVGTPFLVDINAK